MTHSKLESSYVYRIEILNYKLYELVTYAPLYTMINFVYSLVSSYVNALLAKTQLIYIVVTYTNS